MPHALLNAHQALLDGAMNAMATRAYWSPFSEMPSPKVYGETAPDDGKRSFESLLGQVFELNQPGDTGQRVSPEKSPYGVALNVSYPVCDAEALVAAGQAAMPAWQAVGAEGRTGICL